MSTATDTLDRRDAIDVAAVVIMLVLTFSWGLNGVAAKLSNTGFNPVFLTIARSAVGGVLVYLWCRWRGVRLFEADGTLPAGVLVGLLFGTEFICIFGGLEYTSVARSALMVNTMPFWVLLGAHFVLGERMSAMKLAGLALAFCGVVLVFSDKLSLPSPSAVFGDILSVAGGMRRPRWSSRVRAWRARRPRSCCSTSSAYPRSCSCRSWPSRDRYSARSRLRLSRHLPFRRPTSSR